MAMGGCCSRLSPSMLDIARESAEKRESPPDDPRQSRLVFSTLICPDLLSIKIERVRCGCPFDRWCFFLVIFRLSGSDLYRNLSV